MFDKKKKKKRWLLLLLFWKLKLFHYQAGIHEKTRTASHCNQHLQYKRRNKGDREGRGRNTKIVPYNLQEKKEGLTRGHESLSLFSILINEDGDLLTTSHTSLCQSETLCNPLLHMPILKPNTNHTRERSFPAAKLTMHVRQ